MVKLVVALGIGVCLLVVIAVFVFGYLVFEAVASAIRGHGADYNDLEFGDDEDFNFEETRTTRKTSDSELRTLLGTVYPHNDEEKGKN
jgi:hypothetical protein